MVHETPTGARWERLLSARDAQLIDAGAAGERTVAWSRVVITLILATIPVQAVAAEPERPENWVGLAGAAIGLAVAAGVVFLLRRGHYRPWLGIATSVYDVSAVSAILVTFMLIGAPQIAVNSRIVFEIYLLALSATCLRYDARTPLAAGAAAIVEYGAIIAVVRTHWDLSAPAFAGYGTFNWGDQIGRLIVLATGTVLSWTVLHRAERLRQLSMHDPLTGLLNRNVLEERVREEVMRARRYHRPLAVAMIDLDLFKRFNDAFGHAAGDVALRAFSRTLRDAVRRTDIVARFGGEEFVVVLPETPGPDAALKLEAIRADLEAMALQVPGSANGRMTLSAGVATLDPERDAGLEILQRADDLLMAAKRAGRNCVMSEAARAPQAVASRVDGGRGVS
jgi:diguanylate cyclase (GGDEF)-like protein